MKIIDGEALTEDGLSLDKTVEVGGETFRWHAHGPSFFNGLGKFEIRKVNTDEKLDGGFDKRGVPGISVWSGYGEFALMVENPALFEACSVMLNDPEFQAIGALVSERFAQPVAA